MIDRTPYVTLDAYPTPVLPENTLYSRTTLQIGLSTQTSAGIDVRRGDLARKLTDAAMSEIDTAVRDGCSAMLGYDTKLIALDLRAARDSRRITNAQVARATEIDEDLVAHLLDREQYVSIHVIARLSYMLDLDVQTIGIPKAWLRR